MSVISVSEHLAALVNVEIQARDKERERIIKLLENEQNKVNRKYSGCANDETRLHGLTIETTIRECIALIKGEQE